MGAAARQGRTSAPPAALLLLSPSRLPTPFPASLAHSLTPTQELELPASLGEQQQAAEGARRRVQPLQKSAAGEAARGGVQAPPRAGAVDTLEGGD